jgi:hypothetical protein
MLVKVGRRQVKGGGMSMYDAVWKASLDPLTTRREVRVFLAKGLNDLMGGLAPQDLPAELSGLATGSDREVIESYRRLNVFCTGLSARDMKYAVGMATLNVRDLFGRSLQRMKELPPDPRETLHTKPATSPEFEQPGLTSIARGISVPMASKEQTDHTH